MIEEAELMEFRAHVREMDTVVYQVGNGIFIRTLLTCAKPPTVRLDGGHIVTSWDRIFPPSILPNRYSNRVVFPQEDEFYEYRV